ncbi:hypothetical protein CW304_06320 [Bacillus sp. UFRGS-B20]|nr:hypothetical protein CW304_06320 [Bacillus sp. UFRGS-B20]
MARIAVSNFSSLNQIILSLSQRVSFFFNFSHLSQHQSSFFDIRPTDLLISCTTSSTLAKTRHSQYQLCFCYTHSFSYVY